MSDFLPEYRAVPTSRGWRPSIKRFVGEAEKLVPYPGGPRFFPTKDEAEDAAKEYMRVTLNREIKGERSEDHAAELSEIDAWRRAKAEQEQAEKDRVFGSNGPRIVRNCNGGEVIVEQRKKVVRA